MLQSTGLQRVGHDWETGLNWISHGVARPHFVHLFISWWDGHLGCSHVQAIMSNSVVNIHALIQVSVWPCSFHMVSLETKKSKSQKGTQDCANDSKFASSLFLLLLNSISLYEDTTIYLFSRRKMFGLFLLWGNCE